MLYNILNSSREYLLLSIVNLNLEVFNITAHIQQGLTLKKLTKLDTL